jgi:hypothetical protein
MAFLAPAAATAVGTTAAAGTATAALGTGLSAGTALGTGIGLKATGALLAPTLGTSVGAGLGSSMLAGGLGTAGAGLGGAGLAGLGGAGLAGLGGLGLKAGAGSLLAPTLGAAGGTGLAGLGTAGAGLGGAGLKAGASMLTPNLGTVAAPIASATPTVTPTAFKAFSPNASFLNTVTEGAAIPGVTSNLPAQMMGNVAGGPAIQGVTSALPTTTAPLVPASTASAIQPGANFLSNLGNLIQNPSMDAAGDYIKEHPYATAAGAYGLYSLLKPKYKAPEEEKALIRPYQFTQTQRPEAYATSPLTDTSERLYFDTALTPKKPYTAPGPEYAAEGGLMGYAVGGPIETMAALNAVGANTGYPQAGINTPMYSNPMVQRPEAVNVLAPASDAGVGAYSGEPRFARGGEAEIEGNYKYSFDPKTNTFTQLSTPRYVEQPTRSPGGYTGYGVTSSAASTPSRPPLDTGSKTAGGIAPPVGGPGIAALMPQTQAAAINIPAYQTPEQRLGLTDFYAMMDRRLGAMGGYAAGGGISDLGSYSDGGRLLRGPGDGVSDSIPAVIGQRQPARLADGEFVIPARIVSELGNGSTEAGARKLYAMMDRVQKARGKTVGKNKVAANTRADKHLPA